MTELPIRRRGVRHLAAALAILGPLSFTPSCAGPVVAPPVTTDPSAGSDVVPRTYVGYTSDTAGYHLDLPRGWQRSIAGATVEVAKSQTRVIVTATSGLAPSPTQLDSSGALVRIAQLGDLTGLATRSTMSVTLPTGPATRSTYSAMSAASPAGQSTQKDVLVFIIPDRLRYATLIVTSAAGADISQLSRVITDSFRWRRA